MIKGFITRQLALKVKWQAFNTVLEVELLLVGDCNVEWIITEQWSRSRGGRQGQREGEASGASVWAVRIFFRRRFRSDDGNSMGIQERAVGALCSSKAGLGTRAHPTTCQEQGSWGIGTAPAPGIVLLSGDKAKTRLDQPQWGPGQGCGEEETALHGNVDLESDWSLCGNWSQGVFVQFSVSFEMETTTENLTSSCITL